MQKSKWESPSTIFRAEIFPFLLSLIRLDTLSVDLSGCPVSSQIRMNFDKIGGNNHLGIDQIQRHSGLESTDSRNQTNSFIKITFLTVGWERFVVYSCTVYYTLHKSSWLRWQGVAKYRSVF